MQPIPDPKPPRRIAPNTTARDWAIAGVFGLTVLGFVFYAVLSFSRQAESVAMTDGIIVGKTFVPQPETQITVGGQGGVRRRELAGDYFFQVRVPQQGGRIRRVKVDAATYANRQAGEHILFKEP